MGILSITNIISNFFIFFLISKSQIAIDRCQINYICVCMNRLNELLVVHSIHVHVACMLLKHQQFLPGKLSTSKF